MPAQGFKKTTPNKLNFSQKATMITSSESFKAEKAE